MLTAAKLTRLVALPIRPLTLSAAKYSNKRLVPDPEKVPRTEPIDLRDEAFKKSNTLEDYSIYDTEVPPNNIDFLLPDGFAMTNGSRIISTPEEMQALILLGKDAYQVKLEPGDITGLDSGRVEISPRVLGAFEIIYPKPEMVVVGLGKESRILGPKTAQFFRSHGIRAQVGNTRHGASHFDMLATERGDIISGFILPPNM